MTCRARVWTILAVAAALLAACGSGATPGDPATTAGAPAPAQGCPDQVELPSGTSVRGSSPASGSEVTLDAGDQFFDPTCVTAVSEGTVSVTVTNVGESLHNIKIEDQGIDRDVGAGESVTVPVDVPSSGAVTFVCKYHTAVGMNGALVAGR